MSLLVSGPSVVSVGASGGITATLFMISSRLPEDRPKTSAQFKSVMIAIPALVSLCGGVVGIHPDCAARAYGALLGAAMGLLVLRTWREGSPLPQRFPTC